MKYWLMKNEPEAFSIDDLARVKIEHWDGIRNYQARNFMRDDMSVGDGVLFYHSSCKVPGIVGIAEIASEAYPDHTAFDPEEHYYDRKSNPDNPTWVMVDVKFVARLDTPITLQELRTYPELSSMRLLQRGNRLSITPVDIEHWDYIHALMSKFVLT
jgi:predicted RNA-binding protein with PUA-like domain